MNKKLNRRTKMPLRINALRRVLREPARGQALVEYALITVLLVLAVIVALMATGPAIGNIFSNTVFNLIGAPEPSVTPLNPTEFWQLVTAVASYTPDTVVLPTNTLAPPTNTPTVGPSPTSTPITPTATPTVTETPGPSPTPEDIIHDAPFYDNISNPEWWRLDEDSIFTGFDPWQVDWWATSSSNRTVASVDSIMGGSPTCTSTYDQPDLEFFWGSSGGPTPGGTCSGSPWRTDDFASRWTRTVNFDQPTTVNLSVTSDDGIRVRIDGTLVSGLGNWNYHGDETYTAPYSFTAGQHTIVVEYFEGGWGATMVFRMRAATEDVGSCGWDISSEAVHTGPTAWSDSPGGINYSNNSLCHLAIRGAVNLGTLTEPPRMTFWDQYSLDNYDVAWLQVREYAGPGNTGPWFAKKIHENYGELLSWQRQFIDLANYDGINNQTLAPTTVDFTGKTIEFRFVLEADGSNTRNGWWVDDIAIEENVLQVYKVGFFDDLESGDGNWLPGGTWAISGEHTRSGAGAYSDSPGTYYSSWTDSTLELDGVIDLTGADAINPELVFYHSWYLDLGDSIYAEVSSDRVNWVSLTESRPFEALERESRNDLFVRETLSLTNFQDQPYYLRFRINSDGSSNRDGWWIDDIALQNKITGNLPYPFFDNMDGGGSNWLPDGEWSLSPEQVYSGTAAWSDSPGKYYEDDSNASLQTIRPFLMTTAAATNPELSFFHQRYLGRYDKLYVEVSTDDGATWTSVWSYQYNGSGSVSPEAPGVALNEFNEQRGWEYVSINMRSYISDTVGFYVRFRLDALTDSQTRDGVWIDDVRLAEHVTAPHSFPFYDDMEGSVNWRTGGQWEVHNEASHSGSYALSDSPGGNYRDDSFSVVELIQPVDLTGLTAGTDFPVLSWWDRFRLDRYDYSRVQVSTWLGGDWDNWGPWQEVSQYYYTNTMSWDYRQVDMRPYIGQTVRIRFILDALRDSRTDPGWWVDDVSLDLYNPPVYGMPYTNTADTTNQFITEGTWGLGQVYYGSGSGPAALGPGIWQATFYDLRTASCGSTRDKAAEMMDGDADFSPCSGTQSYTPVGPAPMVDIDFVCDSLSSPNPDGTCNTTSWKPFDAYDHDQMAILFTRDITVEDGTYEFSIRHDDGTRLYITDYSNGQRTRIMNQWYDTGPRTDTTSRTLSAGTYQLEVWYYENGGGATMQLSVAKQSFSFHDSPSGNYQYRDNMSIILDGVIDMTSAGTTGTPSLSWQQTYNVNDSSGACMILEVMFPYETGQFGNWIQIYKRCDAYQGTWAEQNAPLRGPIETALGSPFDFTGTSMTFRFRLDARYTSDTDAGWWIDNLILAD